MCLPGRIEKLSLSCVPFRDISSIRLNRGPGCFAFDFIRGDFETRRKFIISSIRVNGWLEYVATPRKPSRRDSPIRILMLMPSLLLAVSPYNGVFAPPLTPGSTNGGAGPGAAPGEASGGKFEVP